MLPVPAPAPTPCLVPGLQLPNHFPRCCVLPWQELFSPTGQTSTVAYSFLKEQTLQLRLLWPPRLFCLAQSFLGLLPPGSPPAWPLQRPTPVLTWAPVYWHPLHSIPYMHPPLYLLTARAQAGAGTPLAEPSPRPHSGKQQEDSRQEAAKVRKASRGSCGRWATGW